MPPKRPPTVSPFLLGQQDLQKQMKCDYVIIEYAKDPRSPPPALRQPPQYIVKNTIPVKLSHQVFLQMSFGILKDRLLEHKKKGTPLQSTQEACTHSTDSLQQDVLAMFFFLGRFLSEMEKCRREVEGSVARSQRLSSRSKSTTGRATSPNKHNPIISKQHVRFQLLLEYGLDVQTLLENTSELNKSDIAMERYWRQTMVPREVTEEEFYNQVGKASGMAQECSIM